MAAKTMSMRPLQEELIRCREEMERKSNPTVRENVPEDEDTDPFQVHRIPIELLEKINSYLMPIDVLAAQEVFPSWLSVDVGDYVCPMDRHVVHTKWHLCEPFVANQFRYHEVREGIIIRSPVPGFVPYYHR